MLKKFQQKSIKKIFSIAILLATAPFLFLTPFPAQALSIPHLPQIADRAAKKVTPIYSFEFAGQSPYLVLKPGEKSTLWVNLLNNGNTVWQKEGPNPFRLGTSRLKDRQSEFWASPQNSNQFLRGWLSPNRITMEESFVPPGQIAHFIFEIKAPEKIGIYKEYFRPVIDDFSWIDDIGLFWEIKVSDGKTQKLPIFGGELDKKIIISISDQRLKCLSDNDVIYDYPVSTGLWKTPTPIGNFKIEDKSPVAYSRPYNLYMNWWMAITPSGSHGIHELPYWKTRKGIIYEGASHLGQRASHGCIRLGRGPAKQVYDWAEVGTPVKIVN